MAETNTTVKSNILQLKKKAQLFFKEVFVCIT